MLIIERDARRGTFTAWYGGLCGHSDACPMRAVAECLAHAARGSAAFGWFGAGWPSSWNRAGIGGAAIESISGKQSKRARGKK